MTDSIFHMTAIRLEPGSIIKPGNWGRILRRYQRIHANNQSFGDPWILSRELIFEMVRRQSYPDKPSRWESAFCFLSPDDIAPYRQVNDSGKLNIVYRVEIVDDDAPKHFGGLDALSWLPEGGVFVENYEAIAAMYWSQPLPGPQELVTTSRLRVLEEIV